MFMILFEACLLENKRFNNHFCHVSVVKIDFDQLNEANDDMKLNCDSSSNLMCQPTAPSICQIRFHMQLRHTGLVIVDHSQSFFI